MNVAQDEREFSGGVIIILETHVFANHGFFIEWLLHILERKKLSDFKSQTSFTAQSELGAEPEMT